MTREERISKQRALIKDLMGYFSENKMDEENQEQAKKLIEEVIIRILQIELEELGYTYDESNDASSSIGIQLIDNESRDKGIYNAGYNIIDGEIKKVEKPSITINLSSLYTDLKKENPETRLLACKSYVHTIFHELQHHIQHMMTQIDSISSKRGIMYARDIILHFYLEKKWYSQAGNYAALTTENDADQAGYRKYLEIMGNDDVISSLRDIEIGELQNQGYRADVDSRDKKEHYSYGLQERDDVAIPILDDLMKRHAGEILEICPILKKEYNSDGTKKDVFQLIQNMQEEVTSISINTNLSEEEKRILLKDTQEMYYELIYRQLESIAPEKLEQISMQIGENGTINILEQMLHYFQCELENRLAASARMNSAKSSLQPLLMLDSKSVSIEKVYSEEDLWRIHDQSKDRLECYYQEKIKKIEMFIDNIQMQQRRDSTFEVDDITACTIGAGVSLQEINGVAREMRERINGIQPSKDTQK